MGGEVRGGAEGGPGRGEGQGEVMGDGTRFGRETWEMQNTEGTQRRQCGRNSGHRASSKMCLSNLVSLHLSSAKTFTVAAPLVTLPFSLRATLSTAIEARGAKTLLSGEFVATGSFVAARPRMIRDLLDGNNGRWDRILPDSVQDSFTLRLAMGMFRTLNSVSRPVVVVESSNYEAMMKDPAGALNHHQARDKLLICDLLSPVLLLEGRGPGAGRRQEGQGGREGREGVRRRRGGGRIVTGHNFNKTRFHRHSHFAAATSTSTISSPPPSPHLIPIAVTTASPC
ncbi:hypothetical protein O3P69_013289 [Scylla paramamosain]|uniref:Uncharacterized protein n=1 Tax=Scylla paramamosain TaxID=85552 RepID=A0AAW0U149_SCYPA